MAKLYTGKAVGNSHRMKNESTTMERSKWKRKGTREGKEKK